MFFHWQQVKSICKSNCGLCKVEKCKKRGQFFKRLDKHLARVHPEITERQHNNLPQVPYKEASHMQYRVKEQCGLCGKTLLLRPHLKTHKIKTWDEYISKLKEIPRKQDQGSPLLTRKETPSAGLNSLLRQISATTTSTAKCSESTADSHTNVDQEQEQSTTTTNTANCSTSTADSHEAKGREQEAESGSPADPLILKVNFTEEEYLRFCVHNTNSYMVLATHHAIVNGKSDPSLVLNHLSKNKLTIDHCKYIVDMNLIPTLYGFYRFASYYPYPKGKCISCTAISCECGKLPRPFYLFCRRACNAVFNCTKCKTWASGYHICEDFFWCEVCSNAAKNWPLQMEFFP